MFILKKSREKVHVIWDEFLKIIKEEAGSQIVETWFKAVSLDEWNASSKTVTLLTPNQFVLKWVKQHYLSLIKTHLARLLHSNEISILFLCKNDIQQREEIDVQKTIIPASVIHPVITHKTHKPIRLHSTQPQATTIVPTQSKQLVTQKQKNPARKNIALNENYQFSTFVTGPSNSLAHAAARALCDNLGVVYNPLFIYGGTGLGKTHLLHAIGNEVKQRYPRLLVHYETCDRFINEFINSIRFDRTRQFRNKYEHVDLLMLDDIQFLSKKEQTQEIFFHIFNTLYEKKKQIILSSDTFPQEIKALQERIKSRMEWGLVADIQMPDLETKIAILKKKVALHNITLPDDVADFIASRVQSNIRELEGALIRVSAFSSLIRQPITLEMAQKVLLNLTKKNKGELPLEQILKTIAQHYTVSVNDIKSKKRHRNITSVRQIALYLMKKNTPFSLQAIGQFVGDRDHSTVIHAVKKIETLLKQDPAFGQKLRALEQKILTN